MSFKNDSIKNIIEKIEENRVFLPAIQRRFVWKREKIENLFDSIIKDYPIGTFLFWELKKEKANEYVFYEFLKEYDQRNPYNKKKTGVFLKDEIIGVLDGQQRLSSMYLALQGTHKQKLKYHKKINDNAYPETSLYINLLSLPYINNNTQIDIDTEKNFEFKFITNEESEKRNDFNDNYVLWFKVGNVLKWNNDPDIDDIYEKLSKFEDREYVFKIEENKRYIKKFLRDFHSRICIHSLINYFPIDKEDLEYVLEIFIRVNSGATILSKTDLMFSTIVATWEDGREEIENEIKLLNEKGENFKFNNDFLMRCCLVLSDFPVLFKVNSFKSSNVEQIKHNWPNIANALNKTVDLLVSFGFNGVRLTSNNAIIIVAYYFMKGGKLDINHKKNIRKYLSHALLKNIYSGQGDQVIATLRNGIRVKNEGKNTYELQPDTFENNYLENIKLGSNKSLKISNEDINDYLEYKKGANGFMLLSLLYPNLKFTEVIFHQDHIHPESKFNKKVLSNFGLTDMEIKEWLEKKDTLPNLQFMEGIQNVSKNATPFDKWLESKGDKDEFIKANYIPINISYKFENFLEFYNRRKEILRQKLYSVLEVTQ